MIEAPPELGATFAVRVTGRPEFKTDPGNGRDSTAVGDELATDTRTAAEVTEVPFESTAVAVSCVVPATVGDHETEYGGTVTVPKFVDTPPTVEENDTELIVAPATAEAEAETVVAVPTVDEPLLLGEVIATDVPATTVTLTPDEVTEFPLVSVTRAVTVKLPALPGTQVTP